MENELIEAYKKYKNASYLNKPSFRLEFKKKVIEFLNKEDKKISDVARLIGLSRQRLHKIIGKKIISQRKKEDILNSIKKTKKALMILKDAGKLLSKERKIVSKKLNFLCALAHFKYLIAWSEIEKASEKNKLWKRFHKKQYKKEKLLALSS